MLKVDRQAGIDRIALHVQLSGAVYRRVRGEDLLGKRSTGAQHSDDEYRPRRVERVDSRAAQPRLIVGPGYQIDDLSESQPVMFRPMPLGQFVGELEVYERLFEIF